jgi:hypothetical protein
MAGRPGRIAVIAAALAALAGGCTARFPGTASTSRPSPPASHASRRPAGPAVTLRPGSGPVGTRVTVTGSGFDPALSSAPVILLTLNRGFPGGCALVGGVREIRMHVNANGRLSGQFIITAHGTCFQEPGRRHRVTPGVYQVAIGCMACNVHAFRVTA